MDYHLLHIHFRLLPRKDKDKVNILSERMYQNSTLIIYESPHRVTDTLKSIAKVDNHRQVSLGRELTKKFEEIVTADVETLLTKVQNNDIPLKGEFVILIEGAELKSQHYGLKICLSRNM